MKRKLRILSLVMCVVMLLCMLPQTVFALDLDSDTIAVSDAVTDQKPTWEDVAAGLADPSDMYDSLDASAVPDAVGYKTACERGHVKRLCDEEPDLNTVIFLNTDGTKTLYLFDYPVKYIDESGEVRDIKLTVQGDAASSGDFISGQNKMQTRFSGKLTDGIRLTDGDVSVQMIPMAARPTMNLYQAQMMPKSALSTSKAKKLDEKTISYAYDEKTTIEYTPTYTGFKEDIVVNSYTGQTTYDFTLLTNGLVPVERYGSYYLADEGGEIRANIGDIIIFTADERNNTMGWLSFRTVEEKQEYVMTVHVDADWLKDENTVYPIRIDPTIEINSSSGAGKIEDVTINSLQGSDGSSGSLFVGKRDTYGISRVLMKFPGLSLPSNAQISQAYVEIRDLQGQSEAIDVYCYVFTGNTWSESTASWSNVNPNSYGTLLDSKTISYANGKNQTTVHRYPFNITQAVNGWQTGSYDRNKGILFKASSTIENGSSAKYKTFASYNRSQYQPSLTVMYSTQVSSVKISPNPVTINAGSTYQLKAIVSPSNATNKSVIWSSENTDIARVSASGVVTGVNPGMGKIICRTNDGSKVDTCTVYVEPVSYTYTTIKVGINYSATLTTGRYFWYKFIPLEHGTYEFSTSGTTDTYGILYQGSTELEPNDDGGENHNFKITYKLRAGAEYRLKVRGFGSSATGPYTLKVVMTKKGFPVATEPTIILRKFWDARNPIQDRLVERTRQPQRIIFHHSADKFSATDISSVKAEIQRIQNFHMDSEEKCDIAYHFIIDPHGRIWQGAELDNYQRGHASGYFDDIGVLILGDYESRWQNGHSPDVLNDAQKNAMLALSKWLCYNYDLSIIESGKDMAPISTHRTVGAASGDTVCPGENAAVWIENDLRNKISDWSNG